MLIIRQVMRMKLSRDWRCIGAAIASALDAQTRGKLQDEVLQIWEKQRTTVLFVTHSIDEALLLADRILVFSPRPGRIAADIKVDLPRPRTSQSPGFVALARELRGLVGADREID